MKKTRIYLFLLCLTAANCVKAQFDLSYQLIQRVEYRNGYGKLIEKGKDPAGFINQRVRLHGKYSFDKVKFYASIQDIRIWGSTPQVKATDPFLSIHEAWGEISLDSSWSVKAGRQELNYDNGRFLGNLDWANQGRAHDFLLIKYEKGFKKLHAGAGYNQDNESLSGNLFTIENQYKTAQLIRFENKRGNLEYSLLAWNNGNQFITYDSIGDITKKGIRHIQTFGAPLIKYKTGNIEISGFYYYQTGVDVTNRPVDAYDANAQVSGNVKLKSENTLNLKISLGTEILSGTSSPLAGINHSFSPMYGTNHSHNGYMDMFYSGGRYENSAGLYDQYIRLKLEFNPKIFVSTNFHYFMTNKKVTVNNTKLNPVLGEEIDLTGGWIVNKYLSIQAGYSQFFFTSTLSMIQEVSTPAKTQNWAYLMVIIRPETQKKFIGLLF